VSMAGSKFGMPRSYRTHAVSFGGLLLCFSVLMIANWRDSFNRVTLFSRSWMASGVCNMAHQDA